MPRRVLRGLCGVAIAAGCVTAGIAGSGRVSTEQTKQQLPQRGRAGPAGGITWDFETGNLLGWQAAGRAFVFQPTFGDNPRARKSDSASHQGQYWIGTFERYQGPGRGEPGGAQGDAPTGTLTSIAITIPPTLSFRIGGGAAFETRVELLVFEQIEGETRVASASGRNSETMQAITWDLAKWTGRQGRIRIVDTSSGPWGHINVDDFRFGVPRRDVDIFIPPGGGRDRPGQTPPAIVPDLSNLTEQQARAVLEKARLSVGDITRVQADIEPGTVLNQDRRPGSRVDVGTPVGFALAISVTPVVPDLVGRTERDAVALLTKARLSVGDVTRVEADTTPGRVVKQDRRPGEKVPVGTPVGFALAVSIPAIVPDLSNLTEQQARAALVNARLSVGDITSVEADIKPGTVLKQDRRPGSRIPAGTPVSFVLAIIVTTIVPDLSDLTEQQARAVLEKARLNVGDITRVEADIKPETVLKQDRQPGDRVAAGTRVGFALATPVTTVVPGLVGRTERDAIAILSKARLRTGATRQQPSRSPPGQVIAQGTPAGDRVVVGSSVDLVVAEEIIVDVPQLVGRTQAQANDLLKRAELIPGAVTQDESRRPEGTVLGQQPAAGARVVIGSRVDLVTATPVTVLVPQLAGRTQSEAIALLKEAELVPGAARQEESRRPAGTVLSQQPTAGRRVPIGTPVEIVTATPVTVQVPQLVGRTQGEAAALLKTRELVAGEVGSEEARRPVGSVISQSPPADTRVTIGTAVSIVTARLVTVPVPDVVSLSEADARRVLSNVELVAGTITLEESRTPAGSVLRQSRPAATRVDIGTVIDLVIATPVTVLVPGLTGHSEDAARQRLSGIELAAGTIQYQESPAERGTVLTQSLVANTRVPLGTMVNLVVAVPETVVVPRVVGLLVEEARRTLLGSRLAVGDEERRGTNDQPRGTVLAQSNVPGTRATVGTPVVLTVAVPPIVTVPLVVGLSRDEAAAAIVAAGLSVGTVVQRISLEAGGTVLAQAAAPGSQVEFGTLVGLDEARSRALWVTPGAVLLFLVGIVGLVKGISIRGKPRVPRDKGPAPTPPLDVTARAHVDAGEAHVQSDQAQRIRREVRIQPVVDSGSQSLSVDGGNPVRGERREPKRGSPPPEVAP